MRDLIQAKKRIIIFLFESPYNGVIIFDYTSYFSIRYFDCFGQKLSLTIKKRIFRLSFTLFGEITKIEELLVNRSICSRNKQP